MVLQRSRQEKIRISCTFIQVQSGGGKSRGRRRMLTNYQGYICPPPPKKNSCIYLFSPSGVLKYLTPMPHGLLLFLSLLHFFYAFNFNVPFIFPLSSCFFQSFPHFPVLLCFFPSLITWADISPGKGVGKFPTYTPLIVSIHSSLHPFGVCNFKVWTFWRTDLYSSASLSPIVSHSGQDPHWRLYSTTSLRAPLARDEMSYIFCFKVRDGHPRAHFFYRATNFVPVVWIVLVSWRRLLT